MKNVTVIAGPASEDLARKIARKLKAPLQKTQLRVFPDGESKVTFNSKPKSGTCVIVESTYPPVDTHMIHLLSIVAKAREHSSKVILVVPYLGYARQDKEFLGGEIVTIKVIAKLFKAVGVSKIIVVDIHSKLALGYFKIQKKNVSAIPALVNEIKRMKLKNPLIVSPDKGGIERAKKFAQLFGTNHIALDKRRNRKTGKVTIESKELEEVRGRDLVVIDDMISSGGSIIKAAEFLKKKKCGKIMVGCTHALLINDAENRIKKAGVSKILSTNTIPGSTAVVDVSGIIADEIT